MRIGLVCPYNIYKGGGVQECVFACQAELAKRGHEVHIITPRPRQVPKQVQSFVRLLGTGTDIKSPFHTTAQISVSVDIKEVTELLENEKYDLLHFHEPWVPLLAWQILSQTRSKVKTVATFHAKLPDNVMSRTIELAITPYTKSVLKNLDKLTAVSNAAAEYVREITPQPVTIIPNGIDLSAYKQLSKSGLKQKTILYVGRLERRKGVKYLLKAFDVLRNSLPTAKLLIVGDGSDSKKLQDYTKSLGLANVEFLGLVSDKKKKELLSKADLFVSPALFGESFGIVLLEAMAMNLPIVAGDNPGYASVLQDKGRLSLVNPKDSVEFSRRMDIFLTDPEIKNVWQKWAKEYVKQFNYSAVVDKYEALYKDVLKA